MHFATWLITAAAGLAALIYIGRQVGRVAVLMRLLARLPDEHAQLLQAVASNTTNIDRLTTQVARLTATVDKLAQQ